MTRFPEGQLMVREFRTLTEAHRAASELASGLSSSVATGEEKGEESSFRLIDVSMTAGGAWVCGWISAQNLPQNSKSAEKIGGGLGFEFVTVDEKLMNALLSLGPKAAADSKSIGILESEKIVDVLRASMAYAEAGFTLLEVRVKRAGPVAGAYAFFALGAKDIQRLKSVNETSLKMSEVVLSGDYRRYFL